MSDRQQETRWRKEVIKPKILDPLDSAIAELSQMANRDKTVEGALVKIRQVREACDRDPLCHRPSDPDVVAPKR